MIYKNYITKILFPNPNRSFLHRYPLIFGQMFWDNVSKILSPRLIDELYLLARNLSKLPYLEISMICFNEFQ